MESKFNVYEVDTKSCYRGYALVAAKSVEDANRIIDDRIASDPENRNDGWGWEHISEYDIIDSIYADSEGIILDKIYYCG